MLLFKNMKLATKVTVGFGIILLLLAVSTAFAYLGLSRLSYDFTYYREIADYNVLAGDIQDSLLEARVAYKNYWNSGNNEHKDIFNKKYQDMETAINNLKVNVNNAEKEKKINHIVENAREYRNGFKKIIELKSTRNEIYNNVLNIKGPEMEKNLFQIMKLANDDKNSNVSYLASYMQDHILLARLYATKYLESGDEKSINRVKSEFNQADRLFNQNGTIIANPRYRDLFSIVKNDEELYFNKFKEIVTVIEAQNETSKDMDRIGTEITAAAGEIRKSIVDEQQQFGPKVNEDNTRSIESMLGISLLALIMSVLISIWIVRLVVVPVRAVTNTFKEISEGEANLEVRLKTGSNDELGLMAKYFNAFMSKLELIISENKQQSWIKIGQAELNEKIRGDYDLAALCSIIISFAAEYVGAQIGAIYVRSLDNSYKMLGNYAYNRSKSIQSEIKPGEGLVGQVALGKQTIIVTNVPQDYIRISSGTGEAAPGSIIITPCLYNDEVKCILEFGKFQEFKCIEREFIRQISESIAIVVNSTEARTKMQELFHKTLEQSEELQVQQEELRQSNEELEEQALALRESESRLQAQQEELRMINEELLERNKRLQQQKDEIYSKSEYLRKAQLEIEEKAKELEEASRYKSEFLANMSHELRTPLNSILVLSQLLANKKDNSPLTDKQLEFARTINSAGTDLLRLINDILDISKVEAGRMDINIEKMFFSELVGYFERSFREIASEKGLGFSIIIDEGIPEFIMTDSQRVQQIVNNLLANAFKFTHSGEVRLVFKRPDREVLSGLGVLYEYAVSMEVSDTGIGIPADKQEIIFEAFKQSDGTTSRKYGGTGLGLSISRELARLLGGRIFLKSEEGKGSTFTLILPEISDSALEYEQIAVVKEIEVKEEHSVTSKMQFIEASYEIKEGSKESSDKSNLKNEKMLLIIEDDMRFSNILKDLAQEKGFKCITAYDGEEGIKLASENNPDAILLDLGLPGINGISVVEMLKKNSHTRSIPIHVISGKEYKIPDEVKSNIVGYLRKPASVDKLDEVFKNIEEVLNKPFKKLLVIEQDEEHKHAISDFMGNKDLMISFAKTGQEALSLIENETYDCIILDFNLVDMSGVELLNTLVDNNVPYVPIIIYTEKSLTQEEEAELQKHAESIIIKGSKSMERLVAETSIFLHGVGAKIEEKVPKAIRTSREKENDLKDKIVLIVDDDMRNVFALSNILEERGINVIAARHGKEGIEKLLKNSDINLVLMDIMMPEMDGYTAMRQIRKHEKFSTLPVIALTAKAMKEDKQKCIEAGANDYLTKPIDIDKLISLLRVWLYK